MRAHIFVSAAGGIVYSRRMKPITSSIKEQAIIL
jgi:hypothetical protein